MDRWRKKAEAGDPEARLNLARMALAREIHAAAERISASPGPADGNRAGCSARRSGTGRRGSSRPPARSSRPRLRTRRRCAVRPPGRRRVDGDARAPRKTGGHPPAGLGGGGAPLSSATRCSALRPNGSVGVLPLVQGAGWRPGGGPGATEARGAGPGPGPGARSPAVLAARGGPAWLGPSPGSPPRGARRADPGTLAPSGRRSPPRLPPRMPLRGPEGAGGG